MDTQLMLYNSRKKLGLNALAYSIVCLGCLWGFIGTGKVILLIGVPYFGAFFLDPVRKYLDTSVRVIIDSNGITDLQRKHEVIILWQDVSAVFLKLGRRPNAIYVTFKDPDEFFKGKPFESDVSTGEGHYRLSVIDLNPSIDAVWNYICALDLPSHISVGMKS